MKIKSNYILRQISDSWIAMKIGDDVADMEGVLSLNNAGVVLWKCLENGCDMDQLVQALTSEYDVAVAQATEDVREFVEKLRQLDCIE